MSGVCRFEDRLAGTALQLEGTVSRIAVTQPHELDAAWEAIEAARRAGHWVALLADYELGEWLEPASLLPPPTRSLSADTVHAPPSPGPRLVALVFERAVRDVPWVPEAVVGEAPRVLSAQPRMAREDYLRAVERIRDLIRAGEVYQVNYTMPLDVQVSGEPQALYRALAHRHRAAHAAFVQDAGRTVLSFSPELFVRRDGSQLTCRPMKGTAPRDADPVRDAALGEALRASDKNRAENLMIVDLLRNDLGRLAAPGSVRVDALFDLEAYPSVWTLTSTIRAEAPEVGLATLMRALFPCGSITGAPKIAAMRRIRELEIAPRGLYCGAIGWLAPDGDFSFNVGIRTLVLDDEGRGVYGAGGGIVYDSDPAQEWEECLWKARVLNA